MIEELKARIAELERQQALLIEALERLARLGNGYRYGNSEGNVIAQAALAEAKKADVMINGLTEAETAASASVAGLMGGE